MDQRFPHHTVEDLVKNIIILVVCSLKYTILKHIQREITKGMSHLSSQNGFILSARNLHLDI
jgi:hypothetical protein